MLGGVYHHSPDDRFLFRLLLNSLNKLPFNKRLWEVVSTEHKQYHALICILK